MGNEEEDSLGKGEGDKYRGRKEVGKMTMRMPQKPQGTTLVTV